MFIERTIQSLSDGSLESAVNVISYISSLLSTESLSETGKEAYLHTFSSLISEIEKFKFNTYMLHSVNGKSIDFKILFKYQTDTETKIKKIEELLREMSKIYLKDYNLLQDE